MSLNSGADRVDLYYFGRGHTNGDAVVVFPSVGAAAVGDLFAWKQPPYVDADNGGSVVDMPATLEKLSKGIGNVDTGGGGAEAAREVEQLHGGQDRRRRRFGGWHAEAARRRERQGCVRRAEVESAFRRTSAVAMIDTAVLAVWILPPIVRNP